MYRVLHLTEICANSGVSLFVMMQKKALIHNDQAVKYKICIHPIQKNPVHLTQDTKVHFSRNGAQSLQIVLEIDRNGHVSGVRSIDCGV